MGSHAQLIATFVGVAVLIFWVLGAYNRLMRLRNQIGRTWEQLDIQLTRRTQALQELLRALADPFSSERSALDSVTEAQELLVESLEAVRNRPAQARSVSDLSSALTRLEPALTRLLALLEHQPRLRELPEVEQPRNELLDVAARMPYARQVFNEAVQAYNEAVRQWPTRVLTGLFHFEPAGSL